MIGVIVEPDEYFSVRPKSMLTERHNDWREQHGAGILIQESTLLAQSMILRGEINICFQTD